MNRLPVRARCLLFVAMLVLLLCSGFSPAQAATPNDALMQESFQQFDQNLDTGWRVLQVQRDYLGAAKAIQDYLTLHSTQLKPQQKDSLAFHLGHVYAMADKRPEAISWFQKSMANKRIGNPEYIEAYIAFLQNDKQALLAARKTIVTTNPGPWQAQDLKEVSAMLAFFGEPFEAVFGVLNCHTHVSKQPSAEWTSFCEAMDAKYHDLYAKHGIK